MLVHELVERYGCRIAILDLDFKLFNVSLIVTGTQKEVLNTCGGIPSKVGVLAGVTFTVFNAHGNINRCTVITIR